jgi:Flp pilus assembly protein TadG
MCAQAEYVRPITRAARMRRRRAGIAAVYGLISLIALCGIASLAVDWGHVQLVKSELRTAADAAARAGAYRAISTTTNSTIRNSVKTAAAYNKADGTTVTLANADIDVGNWNSTTKVFSTTGTKNAVRVRARRAAASGNAVALAWGRLVGRSTCDVTVTSTATYTTTPLPSFATNKSNPWLAGMPAGTTANGYDSAPASSPTQLGGTLTAGTALTFVAEGKTSNQQGVEEEYEPDGNLNWIIHNYPGAENGIADLKAPISSLVAVFLDDSQPNSTAAPAALDFTTPTSRDFSSLSPALKQPFFIGDGKRANGATQSFVVPVGATRLFVGSMDGQQWSDNAGGFTVTVNGAPTTRIQTVE